MPVWASNRLERNVLDPEGRAQGNVVEADLLLALDAAKMELRMQAPQLLKAWSSQLDTGCIVVFRCLVFACLNRRCRLRKSTGDGLQRCSFPLTGTSRVGTSPSFSKASAEDSLCSRKVGLRTYRVILVILVPKHKRSSPTLQSKLAQQPLSEGRKPGLGFRIYRRLV